ncbi:MAG: zinc chelation protein SecC [Cellvibrionaceae bacterium]|nr:zinc chelation protein SecC [Cellvibrionaceae bacterium]
MNDDNTALTSTSIDSCCSNTRCCPPPTPVTRAAPKIGRNDPCPYCESGKKYKKCCGQ